MDKDIVIEAGGIYNAIERPHQVLVLVRGRAPMVFSSDHSVRDARMWKEIAAYIANE